MLLDDVPVVAEAVGATVVVAVPDGGVRVVDEEAAVGPLPVVLVVRVVVAPVAVDDAPPDVVEEVAVVVVVVVDAAGATQSTLKFTPPLGSSLAVCKNTNWSNPGG